jgi:hypothetical protein
MPGGGEEPKREGLAFAEGLEEGVRRPRASPAGEELSDTAGEAGGNLQARRRHPTVRDRVVKQALLVHPDSYGYRPGKSTHHAFGDAVHRIREEGMGRGGTWICHAVWTPMAHDII